MQIEEVAPPREVYSREELGQQRGAPTVIESCPFSESEDEEDDNEEDTCFLCVNRGAGATADDLHELYYENIDLVHQKNATRFVQEYLREECGVDLRCDVIRKHFNNHVIASKGEVCKDLVRLNRIQDELWSGGIRERLPSGETRINSAQLRNWLTLSQHKITLLKQHASLSTKKSQKS